MIQTDSKTHPFLPIAIIIIISSIKSFSGYGDCIDTLPSAFEREVHVMTNAVRMDPVGFRELYIPGTAILLPENYPAVAPLWYNQDLSRAARFHTVDMAQNCGMQHSSCNGDEFTIRLKSFYKSSSWIGENIATGRTTGLQTVVQWLRDDIRQGSTYVPAADKSSGDGHRKNIMNSRFTEIGAGYVYTSSRKYNHFWTQDFGGGKVTQHKVPAGCHFIVPRSSEISYAANFYDETNAAPTSAVVVIDGDSHSLKLHLGSKGKGTYIYTTTVDKKIHCYYFLFTDSEGDQIRFPETAQLTTGTSICCKDEISIIGNNKILQNSKPFNITQHRNNIATYTLNGVKITGKLQLFYTSGMNLRGTSGINQSSQKVISLTK